jgi:hypothetical protein
MNQSVPQQSEKQLQTSLRRHEDIEHSLNPELDIDSNFNPSEMEKRILSEEAFSLLGSNLGSYLLSGLGETIITRRRAFTARSFSQTNKNITYRFEMISYSKDGLPQERDPLVYASLLTDYVKYMPANSTISLSEKEIIESLGWDQSDESKSLIKRALERYLLTGFYLIDPTLDENERIFGHYAQFRRLLVGYKTGYFVYPLNGTRRPRPPRLMFSLDLIDCLFSAWKRFLGIEFQELLGMRKVPVKRRGTSRLK